MVIISEARFMWGRTLMPNNRGICFFFSLNLSLLLSTSLLKLGKMSNLTHTMSIRMVGGQEGGWGYIHYKCKFYGCFK